MTTAASHLLSVHSPYKNSDMQWRIFVRWDACEPKDSASSTFFIYAV